MYTVTDQAVLLFALLVRVCKVQFPLGHLGELENKSKPLSSIKDFWLNFRTPSTKDNGDPHSLKAAGTPSQQPVASMAPPCILSSSSFSSPSQTYLARVCILTGPSGASKKHLRRILVQNGNYVY